MDVNKYLIIIKNEDKTEDIISYENNKYAGSGFSVLCAA